MSGVEVIGLVASCAQLLQTVIRIAEYIKEFTNKFSNYNSNIKELESKLKVLRHTVELFRKAASEVERRYDPNQDDMAATAAAMIKEQIADTQGVFEELLSHQPTTLTPRNMASGLRCAVQYLCYERRSKPIITECLRKIDGRVQSMRDTLPFIQLSFISDIRSTLAETEGRRGHGPPPAYHVASSRSDTREIDVQPRAPPKARQDVFMFQVRIDETRPRDVAPSFSQALKDRIEKRDLANALTLLQRGEDPLARDSDGWCALHYAARANDEEVLIMLLSSKAVKSSSISSPLELRNNAGATPLHIAATVGNLAMVRRLLKAGAEINAQDNHKRSPLFMAADGNHRPVVEILLEAQAMVTPYESKRFKEIQTAIQYRNRQRQRRKS